MYLHSLLKRTRKVAMVFLTFSLAWLALVFVTGLQAGVQAQPDTTGLAPASLITETYVIFATGPSSNNQSAHLTGASGAGPLQIIGGGIYAGDGGHVQNVFVNGAPPPPIDVVGGCSGVCTISGNAVINYNAAPVPAPILYNLADFQPGGDYAITAGANYHSYTSSQSFTGNMTAGLYYIDGDVTLLDVVGTASIVATGDIRLSSDLLMTTYDDRFPLLFTSSTNLSSGAIGSYNSNLDLTGDLYAPNGLVNTGGTQGTLRGKIYAKGVSWDASRMTIVCPTCDLSWLVPSLQKLVTPTVSVPLHGLVTYTIVLRNRDLASDTMVLFTDTLPSAITFDQWLEQPGSVVQDGDSITWTGTLSAASAITFTFTATHTGNYGDVITNTAYFSNALYLGSASATFVVIPNYTLTVAYTGNGAGTVIASPIGPSYLAGATVTLTAVPSTTSHFTGWSGDVISTTNPLVVTINNNKAITATFITYRVYLPVVLK